MSESAEAERPWYETLFERDWYDLFAKGGPSYPDKDGAYARRDDAEAAFIERALALPKAGDILDLCCGFGRHAVRLARRGHRVTGVDLSAYNLSIAAKHAAEPGVAVDWREADMRDTGLPGASMDAVINIFSSFGYFDDAGNQRALDEVARVLRPGGRFLIDLINRDSLMRRFEPRSWARRHDGSVLLQRREFDAAMGVIATHWEVVGANGERASRSFAVRVYTPQELALLLAQAGLEVEDVWGGFDGSALSMDSHRLVALACAG